MRIDKVKWSTAHNYDKAENDIHSSLVLAEKGDILNLDIVSQNVP